MNRTCEYVLAVVCRYVCVFVRFLVRQQYVNRLARSVCVQDHVLTVDTIQADGSVLLEVA